jgi:tetratricopeptide (TPR) repeat protein
MLRVAPTNEALRKEAFRLFQNYGRPEAAEEVADSGLALDAANADLWDLKSNACLDQGQTKPEKNRCAVDALEKVFELDTTKADTLFFAKMAYAVSLPPVDTARFLKWTRAGASKYPRHGFLLSQLASAYSIAGPVDSALVVTQRLMAVDSSDMTPVLRVAKTLADTAVKRPRDAMTLIPYIERLGSPDDKANMGAILAGAGVPLLSGTPDYALAAEISRAALKLLPAASRTAQLANFVLGLATFQTMVAMDAEAAGTKSCPLSQQMKVLLDESGPALNAGRTINEAVVAPRLQALDQFTARINSLIKAYCK